MSEPHILKGAGAQTARERYLAGAGTIGAEVSACLASGIGAARKAVESLRTVG